MTIRYRFKITVILAASLAVVACGGGPPEQNGETEERARGQREDTVFADRKSVV